jgi:molybdopterin-guanine dinucleotide biosynthesis protein A
MPDNAAMRIGSLILAGGRSVRMGQPKELLPFDGQPLLTRIAGTLAAATKPVVVVARGGDQRLPPLPDGVHVVADEQPDGGPLWGLCTGLRFVRSRGLLVDEDAVFVTGCDAPFVRGTFAAWLAAQMGDAMAVVPEVGGELQPLCACYRVGVLPAVEDLLAHDGRSPRALATAVPTRILAEAEFAASDAGLLSVENVNTPDEYQRALRTAPRSP